MNAVVVGAAFGLRINVVLLDSANDAIVLPLPQVRREAMVCEGSMRDILCHSHVHFGGIWAGGGDADISASVPNGNDSSPLFAVPSLCFPGSVISCQGYAHRSCKISLKISIIRGEIEKWANVHSCRTVRSIQKSKSSCHIPKEEGHKWCDQTCLLIRF